MNLFSVGSTVVYLHRRSICRLLACLLRASRRKRAEITIDINVGFLAPVSGQKIIINGWRIKSGKTLYPTKAKMSDTKGTLLAHGTSILMEARKQSVFDLVEYIGSGKLSPIF
jgi:hypothetical protein